MLNEMTITNDFLVNNMKEASYKNSIDCEIYAYPIQDVYVYIVMLVIIR